MTPADDIPSTKGDRAVLAQSPLLPRLRLHWSPRSPFVRKVMVAAHELALTDRLELVRSPAAMTAVNEALSRDNPLNKLPTLVLADGAALFDSRVICEYFDAHADRPCLFPPQGEERFTALRRQALGDGLMDLAILWRNERERAPEKRSPDHLAAFQSKVERTLTVLSQDAAALSATPFGIGHIAIGCALGYLDFRFSDRPWRTSHPPLAAWMTEIEQRPSFVATKPVSA